MFIDQAFRRLRAVFITIRSVEVVSKLRMEEFRYLLGSFKIDLEQEQLRAVGGAAPSIFRVRGSTGFVSVERRAVSRSSIVATGRSGIVRKEQSQRFVKTTIRLRYIRINVWPGKQ